MTKDADSPGSVGPVSASPRPADLRNLPRPRIAEPTAADVSALDWPRMIDQVLQDPDRLTLVFQPIVSVAEATIAGYEALSRFTPPADLSPEVARRLTPDQWFLAADELGSGAQLEALVVARCLGLRGSLPADCFLTFNVSPHLITHPALHDLLLGSGSLDRLIVEFTEHRDVPDLTPLVAFRDEVSAQGGLLALDDAGTGYSGLTQMTRLRPHLIKLDRALVVGADNDEVKLALAELLGEFAGRIDAWLLAEGVETWGEMDAFARLGTPLAQGYLLGRPAPPWATLDPAIAARLRASVGRTKLVENAAGVMETPWTTTDAAHELSRSATAIGRSGTIGLELDEYSRPTFLLLPQGDGHRIAPVSLRVAPTDEVPALIQRFVTRPPDTRFDPLVCINEQGHALGIIRVERLITQVVSLMKGSR